MAHPPADSILSPSSSLFDMSDDDEVDYSHIVHTTRRRGVKLLFAKSKVYLHPTPSVKDNVIGYLSLLQQKPLRISVDASSTTPTAGSKQPLSSADILLAWNPEYTLGDTEAVYDKVDAQESELPPAKTYLVPPPQTTISHAGEVGSYAFSVPLSAIFSLRVRPPNPGWWYGSIIVNSRTGTSFPPLFFHDDECQSTIRQKRRRTKDSFDPFGEHGAAFWGGDEILRWLRLYVKLERSAAEPSIYLLDPTEEDSVAFGEHGLKAPSEPDRSATRDRRLSRPSSGAPQSPGPDLLFRFVKEAGWNVMEKLSKVTTFTRRTYKDAIDNPSLPPQVRRLLRNREVQTLQDEFDSARIYLARWAMGIAEQSERERTQRTWTANDVVELEHTGVGDFEMISPAGASLADLRRRVTMSEWQTFFNPKSGRLSVTVDEVKERVFHGGLDPEDGVRAEAWLFLLGVVDWHSSADERKAQLASLRDEYYRLKNAWWERLERLGEEGQENEGWREQRGRIEKDVHRTDRTVSMFKGDNIPHPDPNSSFADTGTNVHLEQMKELLLTYNEYNKDLGYVQGMSDLLAPIYAVVQDDAIAFWAFQRFMDRMERNFLRDQSGMRLQLVALDRLVLFMDPQLHRHLVSADSTNFFFMFRMLLVWFKREFAFTDVLRLWEVLWTDFLTSSFHLFVALAILEKHRDVIIAHLRQFDEVLKYVNELSGTIDLGTVLIGADSLFRRFQRMVDAVDRRHSFPSVARLSIASADTAPSASPVPSTSTAPAAHAESTSLATPVVAADGTATDPPSGAACPERTNDGVVTPELRKLLSRKVEWASS